MAARLVLYLLVFGAFIAVFSMYPYVATALEYRQRDNGLAYILLVLGVGIWNGMFIAQLLTARPVIKGFFLALVIVGALLAGVGWFLFAGTASSTPNLPYSRPVYGIFAVLIGLDIVLAVTAPIHAFYWRLPSETTTSLFAVIEPHAGYWLHTALLVLLFGGGTLLFAVAWRDGVNVHYTRAYTVLGALLVAAIGAGNVLSPGGFSVAPPVAVGLTTTGWLQAKRGGLLELLRSLSTRVG